MGAEGAPAHADAAPRAQVQEWGEPGGCPPAPAPIPHVPDLKKGSEGTVPSGSPRSWAGCGALVAAWGCGEVLGEAAAFLGSGWPGINALVEAAAAPCSTGRALAWSVVAVPGHEEEEEEEEEEAGEMPPSSMLGLVPPRSVPLDGDRRLRGRRGRWFPSFGDGGGLGENTEQPKNKWSKTPFPLIFRGAN